MKEILLKIIYKLVKKPTYANFVLVILIAILYIMFAFALTKTVRIYVEDLYYANAIAGGLWGSVLSLIIVSGKDLISRKREYEPNNYIGLILVIIVGIIFSYGWFAAVG